MRLEQETLRSMITVTEERQREYLADANTNSSGVVLIWERGRRFVTIPEEVTSVSDVILTWVGGVPTRLHYAQDHGPLTVTGMPRQWWLEVDHYSRTRQMYLWPTPDRQCRIEVTCTHERPARVPVPGEFVEVVQRSQSLFNSTDPDNPALRRQLAAINDDPRFMAPGERHLLVHQDICGRLYDVHSGVSFWGDGGGRHWRSYVEVVNGTLNKYGFLDVYRISVPITCRSARAAVAWTYGLEEHEYDPIVRT